MLTLHNMVNKEGTKTAAVTYIIEKINGNTQSIICALEA